eukprot:TRINITY_DN508_c0_g1_i2.p2 TRINITY_DN508_c0_g1~~TRINITY_DN508_c0_g1_i2.p2  ORF type:complete len:144 (+),score=44.54 TRINITY_DN508_c0_g1_i2:51-434(+)
MSSAKMMLKKREGELSLIAMICDEDTITGFLLAGVGDMDVSRNSNFLIVTNKTTTEEIEAAWRTYTTRDDVSILLINQYIADDIRHLVDDFEAPLPSILEIPSKDHPYETSKDSVFQKLQYLLGPNQ